MLLLLNFASVLSPIKTHYVAFDIFQQVKLSVNGLLYGILVSVPYRYPCYLFPKHKVRNLEPHQPCYPLPDLEWLTLPPNRNFTYPLYCNQGFWLEFSLSTKLLAGSKVTCLWRHSEQWWANHIVFQLKD